MYSQLQNHLDFFRAQKPNLWARQLATVPPCHLPPSAVTAEFANSLCCLSLRDPSRSRSELGGRLIPTVPAKQMKMKTEKGKGFIATHPTTPGVLLWFKGKSLYSLA